MSLRPAIRLVALLALLGVAPALAAPDLADLALRWARGEYRSPLVCEIEGTPHRGLRRLAVEPGPRNVRPPTNRITLFDLEVPEGTRCFTDTGEGQPNAVGTLLFGLDVISRSDTADRDLRERLRREGGIEFAVRRGRLRLGEPGATGEALREVDFAGGTARFTRVERGSDAFRRLADFPDLRKLRLELAAPDGTRLGLDLVQTSLR